MQMNSEQPNTQYAELIVLGSIMLDPSLYIPTAEALEPEDFMFKGHQEFFRIMGELSENEKPINSQEILNKLREKEIPEVVLSVDYILNSTELVPHVRDIESAIQTVSEQSLRRRIVHTAEQIIQDSQSQDVETEVLLGNAVDKMMRVAEERRIEGFKQMKSVMRDVYEQIENRASLQGKTVGLPTGYRYLDQMLNGLNQNDLIILAARPSMGKTAFALNIASHVGTTPDEKKTVAIFSLEMGADQLATRMISSLGMIDANVLRTGNLNENEWDKFSTTIANLSNTKIFIDDTPGIKVSEIRSKCMKLNQEHGIDLIVIDYLQLIQGSGTNRGENRQQEVSEISRMLKALAREMECPVIALSQLSRSVEARQDKRPMMSDLRESGSIEQDADIVAFLYREDYYKRGDGETELEGAQKEQDEIEIIIAKHRNGPTGTVKLIFNKTYSSFFDQETRDYGDGYIPPN